MVLGVWPAGWLPPPPSSGPAGLALHHSKLLLAGDRSQFRAMYKPSLSFLSSIKAHKEVPVKLWAREDGNGSKDAFSRSPGHLSSPHLCPFLSSWSSETPFLCGGRLAPPCLT